LELEIFVVLTEFDCISNRNTVMTNYNIIILQCNTMFLTTTFIVIMIYVHHVFAMNTVYERWSLLGEIPRFSGNKVTDISILYISSIISHPTQ